MALDYRQTTNKRYRRKLFDVARFDEIPAYQKVHVALAQHVAHAVHLRGHLAASLASKAVPLACIKAGRVFDKSLGLAPNVSAASRAQMSISAWVPRPSGACEWQGLNKRKKTFD